MTKAAYFYPATKAQKAKGLSGIYKLAEIENGQCDFTGTERCNSAREAREKAKRDAATPWNF